MTSLQALTLGIVQGLTEFLPISSSGHLILVPAVLGWPDQGLAFDAAVHLGTALALVVYFAPELMRIGAGLVGGVSSERRLAAALVVGTIPAAVAGVLLERVIETRLRSLLIVALSTLGWGLVLWWADRRASRARLTALRDVSIPHAMAIGCAQILALVPGTSRSGITVSTGLFAGLDRPTAARFAFLLGLPITAGAGLLKAVSLFHAGLSPADTTALAVGLSASFIAGVAAMWFLIRYLQRRTLAVFVVYRVALGLLLLWLFVARAAP